jgi:hypothetical protein
LLGEQPQPGWVSMCLGRKDALQILVDIETLAEYNQ